MIHSLLQFLASYFQRILILYEKKQAERLLGGQRSPQWRSVRNAFIKKHPHCAVCGGDKDLDVHHIFPFHLKPMLELQEQNLITLCTPHHYLVGHLMSWRSWNSEVEKDASDWKLKIMNRP